MGGGVEISRKVRQAIKWGNDPRRLLTGQGETQLTMELKTAGEGLPFSDWLFWDLARMQPIIYLVVNQA